MMLHRNPKLLIPFFLLILGTVSALALLKPQSASAVVSEPETIRVSIDSDGAEVTGRSGGAFDSGDVSAGGGYAVFRSNAIELTGSSRGQVVLKDMATGMVEVISVTPSGDPGAGVSGEPVIPASVGAPRYVAFFSNAFNLIPDDELYGEADVFVRDRQTDTTVRISIASDGTPGNGRSDAPDISADGRFVVFRSRADNLVPNDTNNASDIFVHDRDFDNDGVFDEPGAVQTERVSVSTYEIEAEYGSTGRPSISADGRYVAFDTRSALSVEDIDGYNPDVYIRDLEKESTHFASPLYPSNHYYTGSIADPAISGDGQYVAFIRGGSRLYVNHWATPSITEVGLNSSGEGHSDYFESLYPKLNQDGRLIAFQSNWDELVADDNNGTFDVFVRDLVAGTNRRVSVATDGSEANGASTVPAISGNGLFVLFRSEATNLVPDDNNGLVDIFRRDQGDVLGPSSYRLQLDPDPVPEGSSPTLMANVSDAFYGGSNVVSAEYSVDNEPWQPMAALDGAFDDLFESATATLANTLAPEIHRVCVRATDGIGNTGRAECLSFEVIAEEGAYRANVRCLHSPIWPQPGDTVTITANSVDEFLDPLEVDKIEIWVEDTDAPVVTGSGTSLSYTTDAVSQGSLAYGCRVIDSDLMGWTGWRRVEVGGPSEGYAARILYTGASKRRLDLVFVADQDNYANVRDPEFLQDVSDVINNAYFQAGTNFNLHHDLFLRNQDKFNFWIATEMGDAEPSTDISCPHDAPPKRHYPFADSLVILHTNEFRDCAKSSVFSTDPSNPNTVLHETGHRPFGLADEYCCDGGYFQTSEVPNLYRELPACEEDTASLLRSPTACRKFTGAGLGWFPGADWYTSEPEGDDLMEDTGSPQNADFRRIDWWFRKCDAGEC